MRDRPPTDDEAAMWLDRNYYRRKFGLSSAQMDAEPLTEYQANMYIFNLQAERRKKENKKQERDARRKR